MFFLREIKDDIRMFFLDNDSIFYLNKKGIIFRDDTLIRDNIEEFYLLGDYIYTLDTNSCSRLENKLLSSEILYSSIGKKAVIFTESYIEDKVFIVEESENEQLDFSDLNYKLWSFENQSFIKGFSLKRNLFLEYEKSGNLLLIKVKPNKLLLINWTSLEIIFEASFEQDIKKLIGIFDEKIYVVLENDSHISLNEINTKTGDLLYKWEYIVDLDTNEKVKYSNSFYSALLIEEKKKIVAFTSENYWELDLYSRTFSILRSEGFIQSKKLNCSGIGVRNFRNFLFGISHFIEKNDGQKQHIYKVFCFEMNSKEIIWDQEIELPNNSRLLPDSLQVNDSLLAVKDNNGNLHVFDRK